MKAPKLRFKEFDRNWNSTTIRDSILSSAFGPRFSSNLYSSSGDVVTLRTTDMDNEGNINYSKAPLANLDINEFKEHLLVENDLVISRSGTIGVTGIFCGYNKPVIPGAFLIRFRFKNDKLLPNFIRLFLNSLKGRNQIQSLAAGGVQKNLTGTNVLRMCIHAPSLPEQQKIAAFLSSVDEKIQQLKRKKELLEQYKKGVMQQLFSGKLRFKDENGNAFPKWEERPFGFVSRFVNGKAYKQIELLTEGKYRVLRVGNLFSSNEWYYSDLELEADKYIDRGDLIYAWSASFGPRFWKEEKVIYHYHIWKVLPNRNVTKLFLFHAFMFDVEKITARSQGGTMFHITKGDIESRLFKFPCVEEQKKIANYLSAIDNKIESVSRQIAQTQTFKKGLLQQMFV